ncbi:MAG: hypothetical protein AAGF60_05960 [Pseudomonadota bacterium]
MPRLSLDITAEEQSVLETRAAQAGQSVQDYVRARAFEDDGLDDLHFPDRFEGLSDDEAREALNALLLERIANSDDVSTRTIDEIKAEARRKYANRA